MYFLRSIAVTYTLLACGVIAIATLETAGRGIMSLAMYIGPYVLLSVVPGYVLVRMWDPKGLFIAIALGPCWHRVSMWLANRVLHKRFPPVPARHPEAPMPARA